MTHKQTIISSAIAMNIFKCRDLLLHIVNIALISITELHEHTCTSSFKYKKMNFKYKKFIFSLKN